MEHDKNGAKAGVLEPLLNNGEVATWLGITPDTLRRLAREGTVPAVKVGGRLRYHRTAVVEYLASHQVRCVAPADEASPTPVADALAGGE